MTSGGRMVDVCGRLVDAGHLEAGTFGKPQSQVQPKVKTGTIVVLSRTGIQQ